MLHLVQSEQGYVSPDGIAFCAEVLDLAKAQVAAVATFYTMYKRKPTGEYLVSVCTNTLCAMLGGDEIYAALSEHLGVGMNETTDDGKITLEHAECLAACDYAPVVTVNYEFFDNQTASRRPAWSTRCAAGVRPEPTPRRSAVLVQADRAPDRRLLRRAARGARGRGHRPPDRGRRPAGACAAASRPRPTDRQRTAGEPDMPLTPVLTKRFGTNQPWKIDNYEALDGYTGLRKALAMEPDAIIAMVKDSNLRGRGGAGFPTGLKWQFIPQPKPGETGKPHYVVVNADEGEPGTCRDLPIMMNDPHSMIEGIIIACYAVRAREAFIYIRGEAVHAIRRVTGAVREAYAKGYLGANVMGSGVGVDIVVHNGAGAYICGEETALLDSLEGKRGQPRLKPPFPATNGLYDAPTVVNNVGTLASVPYIILGGADWYKALGPEGSPGTSIYSLSGRIDEPRASTRPRWARRCANCSTCAAASARATR